MLRLAQRLYRLFGSHIQVVEDRTECFDDYSPCIEEDCDCARVNNWLNLHVLIHNHVHVLSARLNQALEGPEDIEAEKFQTHIQSPNLTEPAIHLETYAMSVRDLSKLSGSKD